MARGGKRQGAGRKALPGLEKRNAVTIRLPQWMIEDLDMLKDSRTCNIERALRKVYKFKR